MIIRIIFFWQRERERERERETKERDDDDDDDDDNDDAQPAFRLFTCGCIKLIFFYFQCSLGWFNHWCLLLDA